MAKSKYYQITEGEWIDVAKKHRHMCCECRLIHDIELRTNKDGTVDIKYKLNPRATAAARKRIPSR